MRLDRGRIHIVGIGGAGMSAIARVLVGSGHEVSGSDLRGGAAFDRLADLGIDLATGHQPGMASAADLVVASSAVPEYDEEITAARAAGVEVWRRPDVLRAMSDGIRTIGATGTHGKTSTTSMLLLGVRANGIDPSFIVGGEIAGIGANGHFGNDELLVIEADEAFRTYEQIHLDGLVVTNIEAEHLDHFGTTDDLFASFEMVARGVDGPVICCLDDPGAAKVAARTGASTYGVEPSADWVASDIQIDAAGSSFSLRSSMATTVVRIPQPGLHVVRNALGALSLIGSLGMSVEAAAAALADFRGVGRRWEHRGTVGGITLIDDYAHHPTEVAATLDAARSVGAERVVAVFQPHLYSRTEQFSNEFASALSAADVAVVTDVFGAREAPVPGVSGDLIVAPLRDAGAEVIYVPHRVDLAPVVAGLARRGDLVLSMGAGDITLFPTELAQRLGQ